MNLDQSFQEILKSQNPKQVKFVKSGSFLGGVGTKDIYEDSEGALYIFKHATGKGLGGAKQGEFEPWRIHAQRASAFLTGLLKPHAFIPVWAAELKGVPGTLQPLVDSFRAEIPEGIHKLSKETHLDIAREHIADWICSQHDSHVGNWIVDGAGWICTDKEQGWKYFGRDKLAVDYHPNAAYGERPPLYNEFWTMWSKGKFNFDPKLLVESFDLLYQKKETRQEFEHIVSNYAWSCPAGFKRDSAFVGAVMDRYMRVGQEFREFLSGLKAKG